MRSVKKSLANRLELQQKEAEFLGLTKVASHVKTALTDLETRESSEAYTYEAENLTTDVEENLWKAAVRLADFYDTKLDAKITTDLVTKFAQEFMTEFRSSFDIKKDVGAHEPPVPGQDIVSVEVKEDE